MTVEAGERAADRTAAGGDVSGAVVGTLIDLTRATRGDGGVAQVLALAGDRRDFARIGDPEEWSSLDEAIALFNAASLVNGDMVFALHVGERLADDAHLLEDAGAVEGPAAVVSRIGEVLARVDGTAIASAVEVAEDHALVRVAPRRGTARHPHLCELTRGLLASLPTAWSREPAVLTESECAARGGRFCLYAVSWETEPSSWEPEPSPDVPEPGPDEPEEGLTGTVAGLDEPDDGRADQVGDPPSGAAELGAGPEHQGPEAGTESTQPTEEGVAAALLDRLFARADALRGRRRILLALRLAPGAPPRLHAGGVSRAEAVQLAATVAERPEAGTSDPADPDTPPNPDERDDLVVLEVASPRRRYGHLVVLDAGPEPEVDEDVATLRLFADYAAAELDAHTVRAEAERESEMARALLAFAEGLSRVTDIEGAVRLVVEAVPGLTGCDRAALDLWSTRSEGAGGPILARVAEGRGVVVVDRESEDDQVRRLLDERGSEAEVAAPLFAAGQLLGALTASFRRGTTARYREPELHERLAALADQAATALQNLELLEKVSHLAWHDALTGLPNRRLFKDRVDRELIRSHRAGEPVCLFFVDLDHFKTVNDTFGHAAGDELIREVGDRLVATVRGQDTVARMGGDEFAILLPGLAEQLDVDQLAARTLEAVAEPVELDGEQVHTTASIGIAIAPEHGDSYDELLSHADEAMYRAKSLGRSGFQVYSPPGSGEGPAELDPRALYRDLVHALGSDQFFVVYQPYVDLRTTEVLGVEALLRWRHPVHGVLEAPAFVPLAERSHAIVALDTLVLEESCRQLRRWSEAELPEVRLAVNVSSQDLEDPGYAETVTRILEENGVDPPRLELDVTERVSVDDKSAARANIDRLRRLGVRFVVDDFGTPNSSLARLGAFPVSTLKIDRSFVQVLAPGGHADELVAAIVEMADRLGLECVAEGVETPLQGRVLLQRGCTAAQGYFLCPPMGPEELEAALTVVGSPEDLELDGGGPAW